MLLLLDACIIIDAYTLGVWDNLVASGEIVAPSIVIHDEAKFYKTENGRESTQIDLPSLVDAHRIQEASATPSEMGDVLQYLDRGTQEGLDPGEIEALAIIMKDRNGEMLFCTADRIAVETVAMLGLSERGVSMESMLDRLGLHKEVPAKCSEQRFRQYIQNGTTMRLQGRGKPY